MIFVNFKTYREATGETALNLAKICQEVSQQTKVSIIPVVQIIDLALVKKEVDIPIWVQHADPEPQGQFTGSINVEAVYEAGANGTLLNHSEYPLNFDILDKTAARIKSLANTFQVMICCQDLEILKKAAQLSPNYLAYEPPELIGSKTSSVASEKADTIGEAVKRADNIPLIVGAGIKTAEDVKISLKKGAKGILVSSSVVLSKSPLQTLSTLAAAFTS